jgi:hypothetical protein
LTQFQKSGSPSLGGLFCLFRPVSYIRAMTALTRRRNNDPIVTAGLSSMAMFRSARSPRAPACRSNPSGWNWLYGFYPGIEPGQQRGGSAASYERARAAFERAWRQLLPQLTPESFEVHRRQLAFEHWKHRMWKEGFKTPTQLASGRSECFCGAAIDIASTEQHVYEHHMSGRKS